MMIKETIEMECKITGVIISIMGNNQTWIDKDSKIIMIMKWSLIIRYFMKEWLTKSQYTMLNGVSFN